MGGFSSKNAHVDKQTERNVTRRSKTSLSQPRRSIQRRNSRKRHKKQVKHDIKSQRITKSQLYRVSFDMKRTPWYLGRRLDLKEMEIRKILSKYDSKQEMRYHILLMWRKRNGWRASVQKLIVHLEVAGYTYDEYKSILLSEKQDQVNMYDEPPIVKPTKINRTDGHYRYDDFDSTHTYKEDLQVSRIVQEDIASFVRKSWKKPKSITCQNNIHDNNNTKEHAPYKNEDSGIAGSLHLSDSTEENEEKKNVANEKAFAFCPEKAKASSCLYIRRCSDSTVNYATSPSALHDSEIELNAIFCKLSQNSIQTKLDPYLRENDHHAGSDIIVQNDATYDEEEVEKLSQPEVEGYREQILKMSNRHYRTKQEGMSSSRYKCFVFGGQSSFENSIKGQPSGLCLLNNDDIVVCYNNNAKVQVFDKLGNFRYSFSVRSPSSLTGVSVSQQNDVIVCCGSIIRVFSPGGRLKLSFGQGTSRHNCNSVCCDDMGYFYVTDTIWHTISVYDSKGGVRKRFSYDDSKVTTHNYPCAIVISACRKLLISDGPNHAVKIFSLAGRPLGAIDSPSIRSGKLWRPIGLCFDENDCLYVADCENSRISVFDKEFVFLRYCLTALDGLNKPNSICINSFGQLVVSELERFEMKIFSVETAV